MAKIRKNVENTNAKSKSFITTNLSSIIKLIVLLVAIIFGYILWLRSTSVIQDLINVDSEVLKNAFFGDMPYLFYCNRGNNKMESIPSHFTELNVLKGSSINFAVVNCSQMLPSGKTVYERFKLKKEIRPTIFGTAPWMKALQVNPIYLKDTNSLKKFLDIHMIPKPTEVINDKDFMKFCNFSKNIIYDTKIISDTCIVILHGTRYTKIHSDLESKLILEYPKIHIANMDGNKKRLSFEKNKNMEYIPADHFALKVYAIRNQTHYMSMVNPITWDYLSTFVSQAISTTLDSYTKNIEDKDKQLISIVKPSSFAQKNKKMKNKKDNVVDENDNSNNDKKKTKSSNKKTKSTINSSSTNSNNKEDTTTSSATTDSMKSSSSSSSSSNSNGNNDIDEEALEKERIRKERLRREEMERQAKEYVFTEVEDDEDGEDEDETDVEEEDDSIIEL